MTQEYSKFPDTPRRAAALYGASIETSIYSNARQLMRIVTKAYDEALHVCNLTANQFLLLDIISKSPGIMGKVICADLSIEASTFSRAAKILEAQKLIERIRPKRGKGKKMYLTSHGVEVLTLARPHWQRADEEIATLAGESGNALLTTLIRDMKR